MCVSTVSYTQQNYDTTTQKLAFKCEKSFSGARLNFYQQNPCMTSGIMFITLLYHLLFTVSQIPYCMCHCRISYSTSYSLV